MNLDPMRNNGPVYDHFKSACLATFQLAFTAVFLAGLSYYNFLATPNVTFTYKEMAIKLLSFAVGSLCTSLVFFVAGMVTVVVKLWWEYPTVKSDEPW